jgi:hypothetical protein
VTALPTSFGPLSLLARGCPRRGDGTRRGAVAQPAAEHAAAAASAGRRAHPVRHPRRPFDPASGTIDLSG